MSDDETDGDVELRSKIKLTDDQILRLRALWEEGLASGSAGEIDLKALREEAQAKLLST